MLTDTQFSRAVLGRSPWCESKGWDPRCTGRATDAHHVLPRGRGGTNVIDNGLALCHTCHMSVHAYPATATEAGLLRRSGPTRSRWLP